MPGIPGTATLGSGAPGRVTHVTAVLTSKGVLVRWHAVNGAVGYLIHVVVGGSVSGRLIAFSHKTVLAPSKLLATLVPGTFARISVRAVNADGLVGRSGVVSYVPQG